MPNTRRGAIKVLDFETDETVVFHRRRLDRRVKDFRPHIEAACGHLG